jgi:hypothetical protein
MRVDRAAGGDAADEVVFFVLAALMDAPLSGHTWLV